MNFKQVCMGKVWDRTRTRPNAHIKNTCSMSHAYNIVGCAFPFIPDSLFCTLLVTLFTYAIIKRAILLNSYFYFLIFHKITFGFPCTCYLLNTLKRSSNHSATEAL